jgi:hypothetical protein
MTSSLISSILLYFVLLVLMTLAVYGETQDLNYNGDTPGIRKEGNGKTYRGTRFENGDSILVSLNKIQKSNGYQTRDIIWKKAYILAFILTITIYAGVFLRFPPGYEFSLVFLLIFLGIYFTDNYYSYHHHRYPIMNVNKNLENINNIINEHKLEEKIIHLKSSKTEEIDLSFV